MSLPNIPELKRRACIKALTAEIHARLSDIQSRTFSDYRPDSASFIDIDKNLVRNREMLVEIEVLIAEIKALT